MGFHHLDAAYPWDAVTPLRERAARHDGGVVDLSIGTPVDPTPQVVQDALTAAADAPGYPLTIGTPALREALVAWVGSRLGAQLTAAQVVASTGSKETVALLPSLLGLEPGTQVTLEYYDKPAEEPSVEVDPGSSDGASEDGNSGNGNGQGG